MSDAELLNEIARLAGAINRHKNSSNPNGPIRAPPPPSVYPTARGGFGGRGRGGARGRGGYGRGGVRKSVPYRATRQWTRDGGSGDATVQIAGTQYRTTEDGNKLVKVQDDGNSTPKKAVVNGVPYIRSKSGNMLRSDKACPYFTRTGTCGRGKSCPYKHDPEHVALCKHFLKGNCNRPQCNLSHKPTPYNSPLCQFYAMGNCSNPNCKFTHKDNVYSGQPVCEDFAIEGYCGNGLDCPNGHVFECPEFDKTGKCSRPNCKLKHVLRANKEDPKPSAEEKEKENKKVDVESLANALYEDSDDEQQDLTQQDVNKNKDDNEDEESESESEPESIDEDELNSTLDQDFIEI